jgi:mono/diheme cytochrome c family protein
MNLPRTKSLHPRRRGGRAAVGVVGVLGIVALCAGAARAGDAIEYNRDIRPILSENCFACHGPDSAARKADLRLDRREAAVQAEAIVPGKPEESELIARIDADDPTERMPPKASTKTLTAAQKDLLRRWIAAGAEFQPHWSLIPPLRPTPPAVKDAAWVRNPIDRFVLARLEAAGLKPAPEADRRALARRLSLDLTGLPPSPAEVEAFVNDPAPDAYERLVDRLLDSPRWGEHRGRYWLDAARYADTHGIHFDNYREMWSYRDWVIGAFNRNMPFDRFTVEQLAGDLLPDRTLDQQVASGFNRCNITTNEGGAIAEEYLVLYNRDRTETVSQVWMGLTAGCAVCHDHKFDPLTQREFYELAAFFNNTTQNAMDGNIKDTPPITFVPDPMDRARWGALEGELASVRGQADARKQSARPDFDKWLASASAESIAATLPAAGLRLHARLADGDGDAAAKAYKGQPWGVLEAADSGDFDKDQAFSFGAWVMLPRPGMTGAVVARMDDGHDYRGWDLWVENGRVGTHIIHKWQDDALKVVSAAELKPKEWSHVFVTYDGSAKAGGVKVYINGRLQPTTVHADALKGTIRTTVPLKVAQRHNASRLDGVSVRDLRVYNRPLPADEVDRLAGGSRAAWLAGRPGNKRSEAETSELFAWWLATFDQPTRDLRGQLLALEQEQAAIKARGTIAHVMQERGEPPMAYVLYRGDYDKRRDPVKPDTPDALPPLPPELPRNRLGLAQWLLRPEHPLTARVTVNRFWQEVFGTGLVRTAGDFGITGELPSHPELLDWLAVEFRESGWDVKRFFKLLVTSATYRQSAAATPEKVERDPQNRLLSRGPRFRMDAEMVRDYALAASGLLVSKLGGPSVKPYQPDGVWEAVAMPESNTRNYRRDSGDKLYRRSLYTFWKRAAPPASMEIFNAPAREFCTVRRERTNTPLQALVTLNDPQFVEAARHLAQRALKEGGEAADGRLDLLARRLLARPLGPEECRVVRASLDDLLAYYQSHSKDAVALLAVGESKADPSLDAPTLAAWTMLANELMNLDEVLNK